jgi:hypothetical protein
VNAPVRYASRYGSPRPVDARDCRLCGTPLSTTRAQYCSPGCKQRAYRLRHGSAAAKAASLQVPERQPQPPRVTPTLYECGACGERYLDERRCPDCNRFCRALGPGGLCPHCDEPILAAELLGEEGVL